MFWCLKLSLNDTLGSLPTTVTSIIHLVTFADNRLQESYRDNSLRSLKIYDQDKFVRDLNEESCDKLNDRGCIIFHRALKDFQTRKESLSYVDTGGVLEKFSDSEKNYAATNTACNCSFHQEHQSPCRHIIFLRQNDQDTSVYLTS